MALLLLLLACSGPRAVCELTPPEVVARSEGLLFDGVALSPLVTGEVASAWSSREGLFIARTGAAPRRLGERCSGGLDLAASGGAVYLSCSRPAQGAGEVVLYRLDAALQTQAVERLGGAGRDSRGVAIATDQTTVWVAHHDGSIGDHAVRLARWDGTMVTTQRVSQPGVAAFGPTLLVHGGHLYLGYGELVLPAAPGSEEQALSTLWISRDREPPRSLLRTRAHDAAPILAADAHGLMLGYRDRPRRATQGELHVVRVSSELRVVGEPRSIGRANADGRPSLYVCEGLTAALLPREYGSELFVGVNQLDGELASVGAGHQFYTSGRDFVVASGACVGGSLLMLAAERAAPGKPGVEAHALRFHCE